MPLVAERTRGRACSDDLLRATTQTPQSMGRVGYGSSCASCFVSRSSGTSGTEAGSRAAIVGTAVARKKDSYPAGTLDECFESVQRVGAAWRAADARTARSLAKVLGGLAERAIGLDELDPERLRIYVEALRAAHAVRNDLTTPREMAIARARMHRGGPPPTVLASAVGECQSPHALALADASVPAIASDRLTLAETEALLRDHLRSGTRAQFHVNQAGRMTLELRLLSTLDVELPRLHAMSARQLVHAPTGRVVVDGGTLAPVARIDVPPGWYDAVLCTFISESRLAILLASTERRTHDSPVVDHVPAIGLLDKPEDAP